MNRRARSRSDRCRGFTLVELLVVIAILSLLLTILAPALSRVKVLANMVMCSTNVHAIGRAAQMYAADNNNFVPRDYWYGCNNPWDTGQYCHYLFAAKFIQYLGGEQLAERYMDTDSRIYKELENLPVFKCPSVKDDEFVLTYVSNGTDFEYYKRTGDYTSGAASSLDDLPDQPSKIFYVMEANIMMLSPREFGIYDVLYPGNMPFDGKTPNQNPRAIRHDDKRHEDRTIMIFFDGHAEKRYLHPDDLPLTIFNPMVDD